jgi:hypothetical protein
VTVASPNSCRLMRAHRKAQAPAKNVSELPAESSTPLVPLDVADGVMVLECADGVIEEVLETLKVCWTAERMSG